MSLFPVVSTEPSKMLVEINRALAELDRQVGAMQPLYEKQVVTPNGIVNALPNFGGAVEIPDNSIDTTKLIDGIVTELKIANAAVTAAKVAANAIQTVHIDQAAITEAELSDNAVIARTIAAGAIVAGKISANAVLADNLAANSVTAQKILAGSIQTAHMDVGSINADRLVLNSITAAQIQALTITGALIAADTITGNKIAVNTLTANNINSLANFAKVMTISPSGYISSGQTAYNTGSGFWLGNVGGVTKFSLGDPAGNFLTWDGQVLTLNGSMTIQGTIPASQVTGLADIARTGNFEDLLTKPNVTYIDSNGVYTGTIVASQIFSGTIAAARIGASTIDTSKLTFTPVQSTNVVASINASAEGLRIAGSKIQIDGNVTFTAGYDPTGKVSVGGSAADINANTTTINGGKITTGTVTLGQLNFTPVQTGNVVASINASAEGIRISGNKIQIDGNVTFAGGYDPTGKISTGGAAGDINTNVTTINGGKITTGTVTLNHLSFTPVQSTNVVASINASSEGLKISGNKIIISSSTQFEAGYDPSTKETPAGAQAKVDIETNARKSDTTVLAQAISSIIASWGSSDAKLDHFEEAQASANAAFTTEIDSAKSRLSNNESSITTIQTTFATKTEVATSKTEAISAAVNAAATDATSKANSAETNAKNFATSSVTTATNAQATINTALSDRSTTLEGKVGASSDPASGTGSLFARIKDEASIRLGNDTALATRATSLETTVNDGTTGLAATRAKVLNIESTYATQTFAETKKTEAITAAAGDATTKANTAQTNAINSAATDATNKANSAQSAAQSYADAKATAAETAAKSFASGIVLTESNTRASETGALAKSIATVLATLGDNNAAVQVLSDAFVDSAGRAVATWGFKLDANGKVVGMQAIAKSGGGQAESGQIIFTGADLLSDNFVDGSSGWKIGYDGNVRINQLIMRKGLITTGLTLQTNPSNLAYNPNFEEGNVGWTEDNPGAWAIESNAGELGWGCRHVASYLSAIRNNMFVAAIPGDQFMARCRVYGATGYIRITWFTSSLAELTAHADSGTGVAGEWSTVRIAAVAPESTAYARLELVATDSGVKFDGTGMFFIHQVGSLSAPTLSHTSQSFTGTLNVTLSHPTSGVTIKYTLDGSEPNQQSTTYTSTLAITATKSLKAKAYSGGGALESPTVTANYTATSAQVQVPTPTWNLVSGTFGRITVTLTLSCGDTAATIYHSYNGTNFSAYTPGATLGLALGGVLHFKATRSGYADSDTFALENEAFSGNGNIAP